MPALPDTQTLILVVIVAALGLWIYHKVRRVFRSVGSVAFLAAVGVAAWYLWTQLHLSLLTGVHAPSASWPTMPDVAVPWWLTAGVVGLVVLWLFIRFASAHKDQPDTPRKPARANTNNTPDDDPRDH